MVVLRFTEADADALCRAAIKARVSLSEYVRQMLRKHMSGQVVSE